MRTLIETDPSLRPSSTTRHALTVAFVNPVRGSSVYQAMNSSSPKLYTRRVIGEETLSSTSDFNLRHSAPLSATTSSVIFRSCCLAISEATWTLALAGQNIKLTFYIDCQRPAPPSEYKMVWREALEPAVSTRGSQVLIPQTSQNAVYLEPHVTDMRGFPYRRYHVVVLNAPSWYVTWRATLDFDAIEYGISGVHIFRPERVPQGQVGFAVAIDGESLVGIGHGDWQAEWIVIGHETACGDPIFASEESAHPVFWAMHGEGSWEPKLVAPSLDLFRDCLMVFRRFASGRSSPRDLDANPLTPEEQALFLQDIRRPTNGNQEALGFWAVQVEIDLEAFEG
jgi:hypothetical protein